MAGWCPQCPRKYKAIAGDGPQPCPVLAIAERPGEQENRYGRVLCGKTGQEYDDLYLPLAGIDRASVRSVNTVQCWADNNRTPTAREALHCAGYHLPGEIERTRPEVIVLMGSVACGLVPGIDLERMHGIEQHTSKAGKLFGWSGWIFPMYHPAIGLHESRWMTVLMQDWERIGRVIGSKGYQDDPPEEAVIYTQAASAQAVGEYFSAWIGTSIAVDTESHGGRPWSVQASTLAHTGVLVRATDTGALDALRPWLTRSQLIFHNAAYDLEVLRKLNIPVTRFRDTMQEAFHQGNLPQGLKPLAYQLFRVTMTSYEDVVKPDSIQALQEWLLEALPISRADLSYWERVRLKTKVREKVSTGPLERLIMRLLRNIDEGSDYDPWARLREFWADPATEWMGAHVDARIGHWPILGIGNCSMERAVRYACGDADMTLRVAGELARRRGGLFEIHHGDEDR